MKKILALVLALMMILSMTACNISGGDDVEITLWTYPIGGWGNQATVDALIADFEAANPGIKVKVEYLDYTNGDDKVTDGPACQLRNLVGYLRRHFDADVVV